MQGIPVAATGQLMPGDPNMPQQRPSNQRFRSFAERFLLERVRLIPADADVLVETHKLILQARTIYKMIQETGRTVQNDT